MAFHDSILHSFDYENAGYQTADLIKMDILLNARPVEELTMIVHRYCFFPPTGTQVSPYIFYRICLKEMQLAAWENLIFLFIDTAVIE